MPEAWMVIVGFLVVIAVMAAYAGLILWGRSPNKDINFVQLGVLVVVGVLLVFLQRNPPYVVEEERGGTRQRQRWDRDSVPEPAPDTVVSRGDDYVKLKDGSRLIWHVDATRLMAESAVVVAAGALLCCVFRTRAASRHGRAGQSAPAEPTSAMEPGAAAERQSG
jgi:hypothetical protein